MITEPKIALITGAAKRLGKAIALEMAKAGWDIAVHYGTSEAEAQQTVTEIKQIGQRAIALDADLANEHEVSKLISQCQNELGLPNCIVNNASLFSYDTAATFSYDALARHMSINTAAPITLARTLHERRQQSKLTFAHPGVIINLLDQKLINPNPDYLSYTLSKAALLEATTLLAQALAPNLRVVGLAPGITLLSGDQSDESFKQSHSMTPLGKSSTPQDIAAAVIYLAGAHAMTGTTLYVDGGQHLQASDRDVMFLTK